MHIEVPNGAYDRLRAAMTEYRWAIGDVSARLVRVDPLPSSLGVDEDQRLDEEPSLTDLYHALRKAGFAGGTGRLSERRWRR
ncbi:MAG: hypothetical protein ACYDAG_14215 [Chloroflexota bacterium]